mgnify:CR=1 FL=1
MFAQSSEEALKSMTRLKDSMLALPKEEQDHQLKYHFGSIFLDCPICGMKGRKVWA